MNIKGRMFLTMCCLVFIFCYPINSSATTTTSNVGIVFTEKEVSEKGENHGKESEHSTETGKQVEEISQNGVENNQFPQTGEKRQGLLTLIGVLLLSIVVWLRKRGIGSAKYELKKSCVSRFFRKCDFRSNNSCKSSTSR